jgi:hypothetical protein
MRAHLFQLPQLGIKGLIRGISPTFLLELVLAHFDELILLFDSLEEALQIAVSVVGHMGVTLLRNTIAHLLNLPLLPLSCPCVAHKRDKAGVPALWGNPSAGASSFFFSARAFADSSDGIGFFSISGQLFAFHNNCRTSASVSRRLTR